MYQINRLMKSLRFIIICVFLVTQFACNTQDKLSVKQVMDNKITELYDSKTEAEQMLRSATICVLFNLWSKFLKKEHKNLCS